MRYIASCSFGKDSLAMLMTIVEKGLPLDEVIFVDVRYSETQSGMHPVQEEFVTRAEQILKDKWGIEVTHLRGDTFLDWFYRVKQKGNYVGSIYGFPMTLGGWCNDRLKQRPIKQYYRRFKEEEIHSYIGIAYDEPERHARIKNGSAPLYDYKITEAMAEQMCRDNELLSPMYEISKRDGCWFCPKQPLSQLRQLHQNYPKLWGQLETLQLDSPVSFKTYATVQELTLRFDNELKQ